MLTPARLQRLWRTARYRRLMRDVLAGRPEASLGLEEQLGGPVAAAALALLRLGELNQATGPLARELIDRLLLCQRRDGAWGEAGSDPMLTALCLRALSTLAERCLPRPRLGMLQLGADNPTGAALRNAIRRGVDWLAATQQLGGGWGQAHDTALVTGFVLLQLGRCAPFCQNVRLPDALAVGLCPRGRAHEETRQESRRQLVWSRLELRCGRGLRRAGAAQLRRRREEQAPALAFAEVA